MNKSILSWAFYDWANSAYATTVMAVFFPIFFREFSHSLPVDSTLITLRLGFANSIAGFLIALSAPFLGYIADKTRSRKLFLMIFTILGAGATFSFFFNAPQDWITSFFVYIISVIGFSGGNIFYDSLLKNVSNNKNGNFISSLGYGLGYLGGGIHLLLGIYLITNYSQFGINGEMEAIRYLFLMTSIWWVIFSIPVFLFVKEDPLLTTVPNTFFKSIREFFSIKQGRNDILKFLLAYWIYIDGVFTIIKMSMNYGLALGLDKNSLVQAFLITQFVGFPSAIVFGYLSHRLGTKTGLYIAITIYFFIAISGSFIHTETNFYFLAFAVGLVQGGIQALSRSYFSFMIPKEKSAEFFGMYNMVGKFASVMGPVVVGVIGYIVYLMGYDSMVANRVGISSTALFFIVGFLILKKFPYNRINGPIV